MLIHPSREVRYGCSKPKGECLHSSYLHTKFSQSDNNSRVPTCLRVQCTFSASVTVLTTTSVQVSQDNCNNPSSESHTWPACDTKQLLKFRSTNRKTWKQTHNKVSCFVSRYSSKQFPLPTQFRSSPLTYSNTCSTKHFHNCSSNHGCYLMHLRNQDQRSQTGGVHMSLSLSLRCQPTVSTPSSTVPSVPWRFLSLSLSTPVPILPGKPQCFRLQSQGHQSVQTSVKPHCSCTLSNLRCSTTHIFISQMWQINQGHWQSKLDPPGSHAKVSLSNYHLQAWRQAQ